MLSRFISRISFTLCKIDSSIVWKRIYPYSFPQFQHYRCITSTIITPNFDEIVKNIFTNSIKELDELNRKENLTNDEHNRHSIIKTLLNILTIREKLINDINETQKLCNENQDNDLTKIANDDLVILRKNLDDVNNEILDTLLPIETQDNDDAELEVSAGVGGQEAMLFAKDLFNMYYNYALTQNWTFNIIEYDKTDIGGIRQGKAYLNGQDVFKSLKYECGVHRVQRVPVTEKSGRIHTSTVMVAVLPQPKDIKIEFSPRDLIAEPIKARGPGGQHVNKTESGCRLTHVPTGIVIERQDERFFHLNKSIAIKALENKLYQKQYEEQQTYLYQTRRRQIGTGNRNEKIRTYNYPQNRITDERLNENYFNVEEFLLGNNKRLLHTMIEELKRQDRYQRFVDLITTPPNKDTEKKKTYAPQPQ